VRGARRLALACEVVTNMKLVSGETVEARRIIWREMLNALARVMTA
jgi:hypothetical protein